MQAVVEAWARFCCDSRAPNQRWRIGADRIPGLSLSRKPPVLKHAQSLIHGLPGARNGASYVCTIYCRPYHANRSTGAALVKTDAEAIG